MSTATGMRPQSPMSLGKSACRRSTQWHRCRSQDRRVTKRKDVDPYPDRMNSQHASVNTVISWADGRRYRTFRTLATSITSSTTDGGNVLGQHTDRNPIRQPLRRRLHLTCHISHTTKLHTNTTLRKRYCGGPSRVQLRFLPANTTYPLRMAARFSHDPHGVIPTRDVMRLITSPKPTSPFSSNGVGTRIAASDCRGNRIADAPPSPHSIARNISADVEMVGSSRLRGSASCGTSPQLASTVGRPTARTRSEDMGLDSYSCTNCSTPRVGIKQPSNRPA